MNASAFSTTDSEGSRAERRDVTGRGVVGIIEAKEIRKVDRRVSEVMWKIYRE